MKNNPFFHKSAENVITHARKEAQAFKHSSIGTDHLLLGYVIESEQQQGAIFDLGSNKVRSVIEFWGSTGKVQLSDLDYSGQATQAIEYAVQFARRFSHGIVTHHHLLLGMIEEEGDACKLLECLGFKPKDIRRALLTTMTYEWPPKVSDLHDLLRALITQPDNRILEAAASPQGMLDLFDGRNPPGWTSVKKDPRLMGAFHGLVEAYVEVAKQLQGWNTTGPKEEQALPEN